MDLQNRAEAGSDGHDESVLNPEMPNETDLTKQERRRIEREKLKGMEQVRRFSISGCIIRYICCACFLPLAESVWE